MPRCHGPQAFVAYVCAAVGCLAFLLAPGAGATDPLADILEKLGTFGAQRAETPEGDALSAAAELLTSLKAQRAHMRESREQQRETRREKTEEEGPPEAEQAEAPAPAPAEEEPGPSGEANSSDTPPESEFYSSFGSASGGQRKRHFEDPFEHIVKGFMSGTERLKADRDQKRRELKESEASLKESQQSVRDLERQLAEAQANTRRLETEVKARKLAKQEAEKAVLRAYTDIAENVGRTAEQAMARQAGISGENASREEGFERIEPQPHAAATVWGERHYKGESLLALLRLLRPVEPAEPHEHTFYHAA
jgi:vacuolar-type H+-ATPase subunit I/STV1